MKYMVDVAEGQKIFVYAITDINKTTLRISNKYKGKDKSKKINRRDTVPLYNKHGFKISDKFQQRYKDYIPPCTVPMIATKTWLIASLRSVTNNYFAKIKCFNLDLHTIHSVRKKRDDTEYFIQREDVVECEFEANNK